MTAKYLVTVGGLKHEDILILEESSDVGGVWNRDWKSRSTDGYHYNPVYETMTTNTPKASLMFYDFPFPSSSDKTAAGEKPDNFL